MCMFQSKKEWRASAASDDQAPAASIRSAWGAIQVRTNAAINTANSPPITTPPTNPVSTRICA